MVVLGLRGVLEILPACGCSLQSEDECGYEERDYRRYNISSCTDCMVDEGAHLVLTLLVKGGCAGWDTQSKVAYLRKCRG
jgi:hypothetical protein